MKRSDRLSLTTSLPETASKEPQPGRPKSDILPEHYSLTPGELFALFNYRYGIKKLVFNSNI